MQEHGEQFKECKKQNYEQNKETIKQKAIDYHYLYRTTLKHKYNFQYDTNKTKPIQQQSAIVKCPCGATVTHGHRLRHSKTKNIKIMNTN